MVLVRAGSESKNLEHRVEHSSTFKSVDVQLIFNIKCCLRVASRINQQPQYHPHGHHVSSQRLYYT